MNTRTHLPRNLLESTILEQLNILEIIEKRHIKISSKIEKALKTYDCESFVSIAETEHGLILSEIDYAFKLNSIIESIIEEFFLREECDSEDVKKVKLLCQDTYGEHSKLVIINTIVTELAYNRKISLYVKERIKKHWV